MAFASFAQMKQYVGENALSGYLEKLTSSVNGALNRVATTFNQAEYNRPADAASPAEAAPTIFYGSGLRATTLKSLAIVPSVANGGAAHVTLNFFLVDLTTGVAAGTPFATIDNSVAWTTANKALFVTLPVAPVVVQPGHGIGVQATGAGGGVLGPTLITGQVVASLGILP